MGEYPDPVTEREAVGLTVVAVVAVVLLAAAAVQALTAVACNWMAV